VAVAVVQQILELCPHHQSEARVWQAFADSQDRNQASYFEAVQRTRHSVFRYELQRLIEFGVGEVPADGREDFALRCGRKLGLAALDHTLHPLLRGLSQEPVAFQESVARMIRMYLIHYTDDEFQVAADIHPDEIVLRITEQFPERMMAYFTSYGLDPARCFRHSLELIGGALDAFIGVVVTPYPPSTMRLCCAGRTGTIYLPIASTSQFAYDQIIAGLLRFLQRMQAREQLEFEERRLQDDLIIASPVMSRTWDFVRRASRTNEIVLLLGESGTGKTFIAQKIHELSGRRSGPFIQVGLTSDVGSENLIQSNLFGHERGAFTGATDRKQGLFSLANGGSIFLDEIGDAPPELQAKLLRVIETGTFKRLGGVADIRVDVRIIAATNRNLEEMVRNKTFREDLFFRISVIPIQLPPLRERAESIPALAQYLLSRMGGDGSRPSKHLSPTLLAQLQDYPWPGNIRELDHALKHAVAMSDSDEIEVSSLPSRIRQYLQGTPQPPPQTSTPPDLAAPVINLESLRRVIRATDPHALSLESSPHLFPAHIDYARKQYLATLVEVFNGDLPTIGHFFDRGSEKTLRNLIKAFCLESALKQARTPQKR